MYNYKILYNDNIGLNIIEDNLDGITKNQRKDRLWKRIDMIIDTLFNYFTIERMHPSIKDDFTYLIKNSNKLEELSYNLNPVIM